MKLLGFINRSNNRSMTDDEARRLTDLFLDGATEPDQEHRLYVYYAGTRVADDLLCYKAMFAMYASLGRDDADIRPRRRGYLSVAAAIAVLAVVGSVVITHDHGDQNDFERVYAGSYIIRDGKKITDLKKIMPAIHRADCYVDSVMRQVDALYPDDTESEILEKALAGIADPQLKAELLANL